ncbi:MAG: hypothetical protein IID39_08470 [Planctomycetes bacterium]|nr:hypothetical protein [Planctomycetota bacterium]
MTRGRLFTNFTRSAAVVAWLIAVSTPLGASGQTTWDVFHDALSESSCGIVNTVSSELVVRTDTAQLMIVTLTDTILAGTFVDADNFVFFEGEPAGVIDFADDDDGFRTLWWLTLDGRVVELDPFTAEPLVSDLTPEVFSDVPCDACAFVDDPPANVCFDDVPEVSINIGPIIDLCGTGLFGSATLAMAFFGFCALRTSRHRM